MIIVRERKSVSVYKKEEFKNQPTKTTTYAAGGRSF